MSTNEELTLYFGKPVSCGVVAAGLDKFWFGSAGYAKSAAFGAVVAAAVVTADLIANRAMATHGSVEKSLEARTLEVLTTGGAVYGLEKALGQANAPSRPISERVGIAIASEVLGEYLFSTFHANL